MDKLEKVLKGLECCGDEMNCSNCPFFDEPGRFGCLARLKEAAKELLKAQQFENSEQFRWISVKDRLPGCYEPVLALAADGWQFVTYINYCSNCGAKMDGERQADND